MVNFFSKYKNVTLNFSDIDMSDGLGFVNVLFERFDGKKFDYIVTKIPDLKVIESKGFTDEEIKYWMNYASENSEDIWDIAKEKLVKWLA